MNTLMSVIGKWYLKIHSTQLITTCLESNHNNMKHTIIGCAKVIFISHLKRTPKYIKKSCIKETTTDVERPFKKL